MTSLPSRVALSKNATIKLRTIKANTGITPNISARMAIMLAIKDGKSIVNAGLADTDGQVLNRDVLFGDYAAVYEAMIKQYAYEHGVDKPIKDLIAALVEIGVFKMGHVKKLQHLVF